MAISSPATVADLADFLPVESVSWMLEEYYAETGTRGGKLLRAEYAAPKWAAEITLVPQMIEDAQRLAAVMRRIGAYGQFHLFNPARPFPRFDKDGSRISSASVTILAVGGRTLRLSGLPDGYQLAFGDFLSVNYAGGSRALFEVSEYVVASGSGTTPHFEVTPAPKIGMEIGNAVDLRKPAARMMFRSFNPGTSAALMTTGMTLSAIEA